MFSHGDRRTVRGIKHWLQTTVKKIFPQSERVHFRDLFEDSTGEIFLEGGPGKRSWLGGIVRHVCGLLDTDSSKERHADDILMLLYLLKECVFRDEEDLDSITGVLIETLLDYGFYDTGRSLNSVCYRSNMQ